MAVSLVPKFDKQAIKRQLILNRANVRKAILFNLSRVGEMFIRDARQVNTYKDRTGNLRSSKGYLIMENGRQIQGNFLSSAGGEVGSARGEEVAKEVAEEHPLGFVLVCVAGMEYAAAVEAKGYDVITSSSTKAASTLKINMARLLKKIDHENRA